MTRTALHLAAAVGLAASLSPAWAWAQPATAAPAAGGVYSVKLTNGDAKGISSIYASAPGKNDWGEDLLGKQTAGAGKTVSLSFRNLTPEQCMQDLQMLMDDGKVVSKANIDVCQTAAYRFTR